MATAIASPAALIYAADLVFPPMGTIGHVILLSGTLAIGLGCTASGNVLTTASPHELVTGSRVRIASTATVPSPLSASSDYYALVLSPTTLSLSAYAGGMAITLTDAGTGVLALNEQALKETDTLAVLINKELTGVNGYARMPLTDVGTSSFINGRGQKTVNATLFNSSVVNNIDFLHTLIALGADGTIGSTAGITIPFLVTETALVTTLPGQSRVITNVLGAGTL